MLFSTRVPYGAALPPPPPFKGEDGVRQGLLAGRPQVTDLLVGPLMQLPSVAIAVPVLRGGPPTRTLIAGLEARLFQQRIQEFALPAGWSIALHDGAGADIARRSPPGFDGALDVEADHRFVARSEVAGWSATGMRPAPGSPTAGRSWPAP